MRLKTRFSSALVIGFRLFPSVRVLAQRREQFPFTVSSVHRDHVVRPYWDTITISVKGYTSSNGSRIQYVFQCSYDVGVSVGTDIGHSIGYCAEVHAARTYMATRGADFIIFRDVPPPSQHQSDVKREWDNEYKIVLGNGS